MWSKERQVKLVKYSMTQDSTSSFCILEEECLMIGLLASHAMDRTRSEVHSRPSTLLTPCDSGLMGRLGRLFLQPQYTSSSHPRRLPGCLCSCTMNHHARPLARASNTQVRGTLDRRPRHSNVQHANKKNLLLLLLLPGLLS
jgi:hypothetical protein